MVHLDRREGGREEENRAEFTYFESTLLYSLSIQISPKIFICFQEGYDEYDPLLYPRAKDTKKALPDCPITISDPPRQSKQ